MCARNTKFRNLLLILAETTESSAIRQALVNSCDGRPRRCRKREVPFCLSSPVLPFEMRATARLYLAGKIDQWYFKTDESGIVLIMNLTNSSEAHELLEKLPLG